MTDPNILQAEKTISAIIRCEFGHVGIQGLVSFPVQGLVSFLAEGLVSFVDQEQRWL